MYGLFWLIYIVHLLLVLIYPLRSSRVYKLIHNKKLQIVEIACVFIVSVIPNIVLLATSQFRIISYPPLSCGVSIKLTFYGCVIPTMSINFVGLIVMLFILYRIHYVSHHPLIYVVHFYSSLFFVAYQEQRSNNKEVMHFHS